MLSDGVVIDREDNFVGNATVDEGCEDGSGMDKEVPILPAFKIEEFGVFNAACPVGLSGASNTLLKDLAGTKEDEATVFVLAEDTMEG